MPNFRDSFQNSVQNVIKKFLSFYASDSPKWENISELANDLKWAHIVNTTTEEYLLTEGVSQKYISEIVEAATRVNYGQVWRFKFPKSMLSEYFCRMLIISTHWREGPLWPLLALLVLLVAITRYLKSSYLNQVLTYTLTHQWVFADHYARTRTNHKNLR